MLMIRVIQSIMCTSLACLDHTVHGRPTKTGAIVKPGRKGPIAQSTKGKQSQAPKVVTPGIQAPKNVLTREEPLKITISNDRVQRINMVRQFYMLVLMICIKRCM